MHNALSYVAMPLFVVCVINYNVACTCLIVGLWSTSCYWFHDQWSISDQSQITVTSSYIIQIPIISYYYICSIVSLLVTQSTAHTSFFNIQHDICRHYYPWCEVTPVDQWGAYRGIVFTLIFISGASHLNTHCLIPVNASR